MSEVQLTIPLQTSSNFFVTTEPLSYKVDPFNFNFIILYNMLHAFDDSYQHYQ